MALTEQEREVSIDTLSQAIELGAKVIHKVAGKAASNQLDGEVITDSQVKEILAANLQSAVLQRRLGGGQ